jgi:endonuclease YncB( thermonuclease family)
MHKVSIITTCLGIPRFKSGENRFSNRPRSSGQLQTRAARLALTADPAAGCASALFRCCRYHLMRRFRTTGRTSIIDGDMLEVRGTRIRLWEQTRLGVFG